MKGHRAFRLPPASCVRAGCVRAGCLLPFASAMAYLGIAVCSTWPLIVRLTTHLPDGTDTLLHYWNSWWVWRALGNGQSPFYTHDLFYPNGISLVYHNFPWLHILPWGALRPLVGGVAAYNLIFLGHLALCGFATFLLVHDLVGDWRAAFIAGLIYQCWPYRMSQPSHPNLISTEWEPILLLFLARTVRRGRWWEGLLAGLSLALVGYNRWQLLVPAAVVVGLYLVLTLSWGLRRRQIQSLLLAAAVAAIALTPPALLFMREWRTNPADLIIEGEETTMQTDVLAYLTPPRGHPLLGRFTEAAYKRYYAERGSRHRFSPYLGLTVLLLTLVGAATIPLRKSLPWIGIGLALVLLALGPVLRVNGRAYPAVPMPYELASRLPVVRLLRAPERFNMSLALPVAVLSAYGVVHLLSCVGRRVGAHLECSHKAWGTILPLGLGLGVFLEYLALPLLVQPAQVSEFYARLAAESGRFAILNVPVDPYQSKPYMFAQVVHQHPILQGHSSRYPRGAFSYLDGQPWLRAMRRYSDIPPKQTDIGRQLSALASDGVRYLIVHKGPIGDDRWLKWARYLAIEPRFEDQDIAVYTTAPVSGRDFRLAPEVVPGIGIMRTITSGHCVNPGRALEVDVAWGTTAPPGKDLDVELGLISEDGRLQQVSLFPISDGWPAREWPAHAVAWGHYVLHIAPDVAEGEYDVRLALLDAQTGMAMGLPLVVQTVQVSPTPCLFAAPSDAVNVNTLFDDVMRLLGYRLQQDKSGLILTLYWRSERRMDTDYKVFVHVYDPSTGIPVAQDDAMPLHWTYPTIFWDPGETVADDIEIPLDEAPAGVYGVALGVYDPASGERLPVVDRVGLPHPDGRLVLQERVEVP